MKKAILSNGLPGGFFEALNSQLHHDVIIRTLDKDFFAHKCILACRSLYFHNLFLEDKKDSNQVFLINLNVNADIFSVVLEFIYTERLKLPFESNLLKEISNLFSLYNLGPSEYIFKKTNETSIAKLKEVSDLIHINNYESSSEVLLNTFNQSIEPKIKLWKDIGTYFNNKIFSDIIFIVEDSKKRYYAHKAIIASQSTYFYSLVRWKWKEESDGIVIIQDISTPHFEKILNFLYTHTISFDMVSEALEFMELAEFYNIESLTHQIENYILEKNDTIINQNTVCIVWNYSLDTKCEILRDYCKIYFIENFLQCVQKENFLDLYKELLIEALTTGEIDEEQDEMIKFLQNWSDYNYERLQYSSSSELLKELLPPSTMLNITNKLSVLGCYHSYLGRIAMKYINK